MARLEVTGEDAKSCAAAYAAYLRQTREITLAPKGMNSPFSMGLSAGKVKRADQAARGDSNLSFSAGGVRKSQASPKNFNRRMKP